MGYGDLPIEKSAGKFLKIESGQTVDIHVLTPSEEVAMRKVHGQGKETVDCAGEKCAECQDKKKSRMQYTINVWNRKENKVQIFQFGPMIAEQMRDIAKMLEQDGETIHNYDLRILKTGSGMNTEYKVMQRPNAGPIPEDIELYDLGKGVPF